MKLPKWTQNLIEATAPYGIIVFVLMMFGFVIFAMWQDYQAIP